MSKVIKILITLVVVTVAGWAVYKVSPAILKVCCVKTGVNKVDGWKTYANEKYKYSFQYPSSSSVGINGMSPDEDLKQTFWPIVVFNPQNKKVSLLTVEPDPPFSLHTSPGYTVFLNLSLDDLAQTIWKSNKNSTNDNFPNKKISDLSPVNIAGIQGYEFTLDSAFDLGGSGYALDAEQKYIFAESGGHKFMISLPTNNQDAEKILSTFKFSK